MEINVGDKGYIDGKIVTREDLEDDSVMLTLSNSWIIKFPWRYRPMWCEEKDDVRIDCRKESGGSEENPLVLITRSKPGKIIYKNVVPSEFISQ